MQEQAGITGSVIHSVATSPAQVESINRFIADTVKSYPGRFYGFATLHPLADVIPDQIESAIKAGLCGVKLHPDFQEFLADGKECMAILEILDNRLPIQIHAGDFRKPYSKPARILNLCKAFPKQTVIAAHFGGWSEWGDCAKELSERGVYADTSSSQGFLSPTRVRELIDIFTPERIVFGSDYPMWTPAEEMTMLDRLLRDQTEADKIYYKNFERLMKKFSLVKV